MKQKMLNMLKCLNKSCTLIILLVVVAISALLGVLILKPDAVNKTPEVHEFNSTIALDHIYNISREPHSVFPEDEAAHTEVRNYLIDTSTTYIQGNPSASVTHTNYNSTHSVTTDGEEEFLPYDIDNVLVKIPGKSDTGILIMGHYDSRGHIGREGELGNSYGAADDGYALATMLEVIRIYGNNTNLENSIYVLFTDGEETGLYGAKAELKYNTALMANVNFVLNIEARGASGVAYMFETGANNLKSMQFYNTTNEKTTYSLATAVYQIMPNSSDFTPYVEAGYAGFNFSVLDDFYVYHTPDDSYDNIDASSLQNYSSQILPLVNEYALNSEYSNLNYFKGSSDAIAFNILPGEIILYNYTWAIVIAVVALLAFAVLIVLKIKQQNLSLKNVGIAALKVLGIMLFSFVLGYAIANIVALVYSKTFSITYTRILNINFVLYLSVAILAVLIFKFIKKQGSVQRQDTFIATNFIGLILGLLTTFALTGASFLFIIPALVSSLSLLGSHFITNRFSSMPQLVLLVLNLLLFIPILYTLFIALTVGALCAILLFAVMPLVSTTITILNLLQDNKKQFAVAA